VDVPSLDRVMERVLDESMRSLKIEDDLYLTLEKMVGEIMDNSNNNSLSAGSFSDQK